MRALRHLIISYHTCPTERPGRDLAGGMNVLLRGFLEATDWPTDVVTRSFGGYEKEEIKEGVVVHRLPCGAQRPWCRESAWSKLPLFQESFDHFLSGRSFDVATAHYWMSGVLLSQVKANAGMIFHTLQAQKGKPTGELEKIRLATEERLACDYPAAFLHWHDLRHAKQRLGTLRGSVVRAGHDWEVASSVRPTEAPRTFGWAARRDAIKNFDKALEFIGFLRKLDPEMVLSVAGIEDRDQPGVSYLGQIASNDMPKFYASIDQLWNLSSYETFGLGVLEALSQGATVGLEPRSDWSRRLKRIGIDSTLGRAWSATERQKALALSRAYSWERALPSWERWLYRLARGHL